MSIYKIAVRVGDVWKHRTSKKAVTVDAVKGSSVIVIGADLVHRELSVSGFLVWYKKLDTQG